jgi:hypothetical protein
LSFSIFPSGHKPFKNLLHRWLAAFVKRNLAAPNFENSPPEAAPTAQAFEVLLRQAPSDKSPQYGLE